MRELCFLKLKSGIIKTKTEQRMVPCHYLAVSEQWREVEEEGLAKRNRLDRVVEVFTFVQLDLESGNKADWLLNRDTTNLPFRTSSGELLPWEERVFGNMGT